MSNNPWNLQSRLNKETAILGSILMIRHIFGDGYDMPLVQLFSRDSSTIEAYLEHIILYVSAFIQQKIAEWPTTGGGPLPDLQQ